MPTKPWKAILVAVRDPGARKQIAIRKAARIAASSGARITLFHAFSVPFPLPNPTLSDPKAILRAVAKQRREQLQKLARPLRAEGLAVECEAVWDFPPAHAIVRRVLADKPDLVVAESHRHSRVARWFLANSDWELIRECPCPVWFVKQERLAKNALVLTAIDPTHARAKPAALDDRLLQTSAAVTRGLGGKVVLIHVEDTGRLLPVRLITRPMSETDAIGAVTPESMARLAKRNHVAVATHLLKMGTPADELVETAAELKADLLVMGAVSRSGLGHSHIGTTAEAVIDNVTCDVLIVKPRQFKTAVPRKGPKLAG